MRKRGPEVGTRPTNFFCAECNNRMHRAFVKATYANLYIFCPKCENEYENGEQPSLPKPKGTQNGTQNTRT